MIYFSMMLSTPTVIYKIQKSVTSTLQGRNLKPPLYSILLLLPNVIHALYMFFIWFSPDSDINSADFICNALVNFLTEFATLLILLLPNFLTGILTSTYMNVNTLGKTLTLSQIKRLDDCIMTYANYAMLFLVAALYLMYYSFTMEDCFDEFIKIADTLRLLKGL